MEDWYYATKVITVERIYHFVAIVEAMSWIETEAEDPFMEKRQGTWRMFK